MRKRGGGGGGIVGASAREIVDASAGNYKFLRDGPGGSLFKVFSMVNVGPSAIKVVTTALQGTNSKVFEGGVYSLSPT